MRSLIALLGVVLLATAAAARPVRVWTYEELHKEADVVAIVRVTSVENTDAPLEGYGAAGQFQGKRATATVGLMLKGEAVPTIAMDFFTYAKGTGIPPNGALFADLSKADRRTTWCSSRRGPAAGSPPRPATTTPAHRSAS